MEANSSGFQFSHGNALDDAGNSRRAVIVALVIIAAALIAIWSYGRQDKFLLCDMECGETLLAVDAGDQFAAHGVQYGLLENVGSYEKPLLYTHSVNIGELTFVVLERVGIHSFAGKSLLSLMAYGIGLFYVYLTVVFFSRSRVVGLVVLAVFATTYWGIGAYALNALRVWHMLAFFGVCYHVGRLTSGGMYRRADIVGLCLSAMIAFGCGYDFWLICGAVGGMMILSRISRRTGWRPIVGQTAAVGAAFAFPFVLRQFQILYALGPAFWWQDIVFSLAIKIPGASQVIAIPSLAEIDAFYASRHILRAPASPSNDWFQMLDTLRHMILSVTIPRWGIVTISTYCILLSVGLLDRLHILPRRFSAPDGIAGIAGRLLLPMTLGCALGLAALAPFSFHVYFKHEFPLVGFPLLLAKGLTLAWLASLAVRYWRRPVAYVATVVIAAFVVDAAMVHWNASTTGLYPNFKWRQFVRDHPDSKFLLSTVAQFPAGDRVSDTATIKKEFADPAKARDTLRMLSDEAAPSADFWIYQPAEEAVDFDSVHPTCRWGDWILRGYAKTPFHKVSSPRLTGFWVTPSTAGPGTTISFGGQVRGLDPAEAIDVIGSPPLLTTAPPRYSCIYKTFVGWQALDQPASGELGIKLVVRRPDGSSSDLYRFSVQANATNQSVGPVSFGRLKEPTVSEMIGLANHLKVVERSDTGIGYVIFELPK
ncbi:MAG TPA: hypothetical protein VNT30_08185 [Stellaceae bacterium]|nr:hypothetical protein [Stellaceae bacterium]